MYIHLCVYIEREGEERGTEAVLNVLGTYEIYFPYIYSAFQIDNNIQ